MPFIPLGLQQALQSELIPYIAGFFIFFAVIFFALKRSVFGKQNNIAGVIALASSALIVWWLNQETTYFDEVYFFLQNSVYNLELSMQLIIFALFALIVLFLFKKGYQQARKEKLPYISLAITILGFLGFFSQNIVSVYYLPEFISDYRWLYLIIGIVFAFISIKRIAQREDVGRVRVQIDEKKKNLRQEYKDLRNKGAGGWLKKKFWGS